ncbi:MAG: iron-containing alcohol dehydrogenase [Anaerolineae bacterium]|nr:iron-containing alcohol dehydrogenase [Anaerolineae bacterium]
MNTVWPIPRMSFRELTTVNETRPAALLTSKTAWATVGSQLNLPIVIQAEPPSAAHSYLKKLAENLPPQVEVVYGVGGGRAMDAAKYVGWHNQLPVMLVPTAIPGDVMFTWVARVREGGGVTDIVTGVARECIIDMDVIRAAPAHLRGGGVVDVLSIVTGLLDWRYAAERGQNKPEQRFVPWAAGIAAAIAQQAFRIADGVGRGEIEALRQLLHFLGLEVQLCNLLGHARPEEGGEHYFGYVIENYMPPRTPHGDMVGPGILLAAALHGQDTRPLKAALEAAGVRLDRLNPQVVRQVVDELPRYVTEHELPYGILNDLDPASTRAADAISAAGLNALV